MRRPLLCAAAIVLLVVTALALVYFLIPKGPGNVQSSVSTTDAAQLPKKLIEFGWDVPSPTFLPAHIQTMEQRPFDGIVVRLSVGPRIFTHAAYEDSRFTQDQADLRATTFSRFTDNFLMVWASSEQGWNFLSDSDWASAEQNLRNFARTAAAGGFKGILFDTEPYGPNTWAYTTAIYPDTTFEQLQTVVRQRGARFMSTLQSELPHARVLFTWFLGVIEDQYAATAGNIAQGNMPLISAFAEGMFSAITGDALLIDGNESAYNYTDAVAFDQSHAHVLEGLNRLAVADREAARAHVQTGQAIYADGVLNFLNSPRFISFYIDSDEERMRLLEHNVYHALRTSQEYVWFYSEYVDWWKVPDAPVGLEDAIRRARQAQTSGQQPVYHMSAVKAAGEKLAQAISISGQIVTQEGDPVGGVVIQSGFYNRSGVESTCFTYSINWFDCRLPNGWTGTLTPATKGYRFQPSVLYIRNQTANNHVKIIAIPLAPE